jgi:small subunit ribosomal protein S4e
MSTRHTGHMKRLAAPKKYPLLRKDKVYVVKMNAGPHSYKTGIPLLLVLRDMMKHVHNLKEAKALVNAGKIHVDGVIRKDLSFPIGLMDIVSIIPTKENFRVMFDSNAKVQLLKISEHEAKIKLCKVLNKTTLRKNKIQLNLHDGRNIIVDSKEYKTGDSILIAVPSQKIEKHIAFQKGSMVYVMDGKHIGEIAMIEGISPQAGSNDDKVILTIEGGDKFETLKRYVFVIGKDKPEISIKGEH